ncbi:alginate export family protein [Nitrosomonas sp. Is37]|uniref:alginate export family protein n=1 Tax=Nitrosomonas sp. Is37 TaxID=3080535 RepID=UPI00294B4871|nr:alginate export family protein [Nitrosomonas sp. Is37]MDV6344027.1 alginate export family protein [Nitrosomonas sp. Is37]
MGTQRDPIGQSGSHIGDEIDFRANIHLSRHQDVLVSYSKLFSGNFLKNKRLASQPIYFMFNTIFVSNGLRVHNRLLS